jgi:hypothetical protein
LANQKGFLSRITGEEENGVWTSITTFETRDHFENSLKGVESLNLEIMVDLVSKHYFENF